MNVQEELEKYDTNSTYIILNNNKKLESSKLDLKELICRCGNLKNLIIYQIFKKK